MNFSGNVINVLTAKTYKGVGRAWLVKHIKGDEPVETIVSLLNRYSKENEPVNVVDFMKRQDALRKKIMKLNGVADGAVALGDDNFPPYRGTVKNSEQPVVIFYRGDLRLLSSASNNIAVIGLLSPDPDTIIRERELVGKLVQKGAAIVSGLAAGCDSIAHEQALRSNGRTVAILPGPLHDILPKENRKLAEEIVRKKGLLITEYFESHKSRMELNGRYQDRDRLQALFSDTVILTASYAKNRLGNDSGSRLAMGYALNYSIPRALMYDQNMDNGNPKYDLNRQLIGDDKKITVINSGNLPCAVEKIVSNRPYSKDASPCQGNLFDLL